MSAVIADTLAIAVLAYAALGLAFAIAFVRRGAAFLDPKARAGSRPFKLLILPASAALWPILAVKWLRWKPAPSAKATP